MISNRKTILAAKGIGEVDKFLLVVMLVLLTFGVLMVFDASAFYAEQNFGTKYRFLILQACWICLGLIGCFVMSVINLELVKKYAGFLIGLAICFLAFILLPTPFSPEIYGARRWLYLNPDPLPRIPMIGIVGFQPSEFTKLAGIIFGAAFFTGHEKLPFQSVLSSIFNFRGNNRQRFFRVNSFQVVSKSFVGGKDISILTRNYLVAILAIAGLIAVEPDFTTAFITFGILISVAYFAYAPLKTLFLYLFPIGIATTIYALSSPYRMERIQTLLNPDDIDKLGAGYHIRQIMIALGSGGFWGLGFGNSRQKYAYLPEVIGDSIFAVVGEELGFLGTLFLISLFVLLIGRCFYIARKTQDNFSSLLVKGITIWIAIQALMNLTSMVRIMPLTGVPLPLVSYGGSSTLFMLLGLGLVLNVSRSISESHRR